MQTTIPVKEALQFWMGKVLEEARAEGTPLTEVEAWMLEYSQELQEEMTSVREEFDEQKMGPAFEKKVVNWLRARYQRDAQVLGPDGMEAYRRNYQAFKKKPYYLSFLVSDALLDRMEPFTLALTTTQENFMRAEKKVHVVPLNAVTITLSVMAAFWFVATDPLMDRWVTSWGIGNKLQILVVCTAIYVPLTLSARGLIFLLGRLSNHRTL